MEAIEMKKVILSAKKLCKSFSNEGIQQHIIKNLDLDIYEGDFTVIMGSSGAGKSTLMYTLSGMDTPTLGEIYFLGENISKYSSDQLTVFRRNHCGFIFQQSYLLNNMSIMDNVMAAGLLSSHFKKQLRKEALELFQEVNLNEKLVRKFPTQLSGGELQRAGIVRALINKPEVVFADEPTGALNSANTTAVLDVFSNINSKGQSIIMVTHDIKSAMRANRIIYLKDGTIQGECHLDIYQGEKTDRQDKVRGFLMEMGW